MSTKLKEFESIGERYASQFRKLMKIDTVDDFLDHSIDEMHEITKIEKERLSQWSDIINMYTIPGLSPRESEILFYANVNSVDELSHRQTIRIFHKFREIDEETHYVILQLPTFEKIENWIYFAKLMSRRIKNDLNIPLIILPMVKIANAIELKQYNIITIADFLRLSPVIKDLRNKANFSKKDFRALLNIIEFIKIPGIDPYLAKLFMKSGIDTVEKLVNLDLNTYISTIKYIQMEEKDTLEFITLEKLSELQNAVKLALETSQGGKNNDN